MNRISEKINQLKHKKNAVVLAHTYQRPEIQDVADFVGDSLDLSLKVKKTDAKVVVFCGVRFMAETAKLISPEKIVLLPELNAGCPMADMITADELRDIKRKYPDHAVVTYVNSTAEVKAESDICCTSSNAVRIVSSIPKEKGVIFVPDFNLGSYVKKQLKKDNMVLWPGYCSIHANITEQEILELKAKHKEAVVFAHPECKSQVLSHADFILSTSAMIKKASELKDKEIIIVTEQGILHPLKRACPDKVFYSIQKAMCPNMKKTTIDLVLESLELMQHEITLDELILKNARRAVDRMLEIS